MAVGRHDRQTRRRDAERKRITVTLRGDDFVRLQNAVASVVGLSVQTICEQAILGTLERLEREHGGPFPTAPPQRTGSRYTGNHTVDIYV